MKKNKVYHVFIGDVYDDSCYSIGLFIADRISVAKNKAMNVAEHVDRSNRSDSYRDSRAKRLPELDNILTDDYSFDSDAYDVLSSIENNNHSTWITFENIAKEIESLES